MAKSEDVIIVERRVLESILRRLEEIERRQAEIEAIISQIKAESRK